MITRRRNAGRRTQIPLAVTLFLWLQTVHVAHALLTNFTVEDLHYYPPEAWRWSEVPDLAPSFGGAEKKLLEKGEHDPSHPGVEYDRRMGGSHTGTFDIPDSSVVTPSLSVTSSHFNQKRRALSLQSLIRGSGEEDQPASWRTNSLYPTLKFDFTGSAIYIFAYTPLPPSSSIILDGHLQEVASYLPPSAASATSLATQVDSITSKTVFSNRTLNDGPHSVTLNLPSPLQDDIVFLLDRIVFSRDISYNSETTAPPSPAPTLVRRQDSSSGSSTSSRSTDSSQPSSGSGISSNTDDLTATETLSSPSASPSSTDASKKRNIATFGAAVGGSVGVLALFSAGLALSIIRRRYLAKKREREDREAHPEFPDPSDPNSSQDIRRSGRRAQAFGDEGIFGGRGRGARDMEERRGPEASFSSDGSFVPRFFPGTEVPPPAAPSLATAQQAQRGSARTHARRRTLDDEPPPPMYNDALEAPIVPPPGLVTQSLNHPYIHRAERRLSLDSSEELGLPVAIPPGVGVGRDDMSYADIPPSDPPPPEVVAATIPLTGPPPSFPEAMASAASLPVAPLPTHQSHSSRSLHSYYSMHSIHARIPQGEAGRPVLPTQAPVPEVVALLNPRSASRPASMSSSGSISGIRNGL